MTYRFSHAQDASGRLHSQAMQTLTELNDQFGIPHVLVFAEGKGGLLCAQITTEACTATLYLQGSHLVHWQPAGQKPVLFLSDRSNYAPGKAIRGGVPVIFPWFGARTGARTDGPMHGFARTQLWQVAFAAVSGKDLHLTLTLGPTDESRGLGYDHFRVAYELILGSTLTLRISVVNLDPEEQAGTPMHFEEALHSYLAVGEPEHLRIYGLGQTEFLDKTDGFKRKKQTDDVLTLHEQTDRPYLNTTATVTVEDPDLGRRLVVAKQGSKTTVVWNPWSELAAKMSDFPAEGWRGMTCIETANAAENAVTLKPKEAHTMEAKISVEPFSGSATERTQ
jgi:glucose-6-phosphate 1-epimerase